VSPDLVVVGAGTVGGWAAWFAADLGAEVLVLERGEVGEGASSRAAGIVRAQGGTPTAVRLGRWSIDFYERQPALIGTDSGFRRRGYLLLARTGDAARAARARIEMQRAEGLDVRWVEPAEARRLNPSLAAAGFVGASHCPIEGFIDPPRNVRAYSLALQRAGVELRERTACDELVVEDGRVTGVRAGGEVISTTRVLLTGGPSLRATSRALGLWPVPAGGARHQVAVTEPHPELDAGPLPMVFDLAAGVYWRQHEGGLLFGWSDPAERPGEARSLDLAGLDATRELLAASVPATAGLGVRKAWAATIDYTPDHLPIVGPAHDPARREITGLTVASAAGHGMMWGPAVARAAAETALTGESALLDVADLGLDRFDELGRSRLATDAVALPFPSEPEDSVAVRRPA
jgi:sarcosine oxidase, subunit beta